MAWSPLFGSAESAPIGRHVVLLDGRAASFSLSIDDSPALLESLEPVSWAWSSFLRHSLTLTTNGTYLQLRTWDNSRDSHSLRVPRTAADAEELVRKLARAPRPKAVDVVARMVSAFKSLRAIMSGGRAQNIDVVRAFNGLISFAEVEGVNALKDLNRLGDLIERRTDLESLRRWQDQQIDPVVDSILSASPRWLPPMNARLLTRHAAGFLYQEAHFELERTAIVQRSLFGGTMPNTTGRGQQQRDARFTPPELARTLIHQALKHLSNNTERLSVLDPACGSGVFLQELLRELETRQFAESVDVRGFDLSDISIEFARESLTRALLDATSSGLLATGEWKVRNALESEEWGEFDLILMNPPFAAYRDMTDADQHLCKGILGEAAVGQFDKAMAFIWRAIQHVKPNGVVASVLPSTLLEGSNGQKWRERLLSQASIRAIGRFAGYSYFHGAMVEPAFIVLEKHGPVANDSLIAVLVAEETSEGEAMRAMRRGYHADEKGAYLFTFQDAAAVTSDTWMPKNHQHQSLLKALAGHRCVEDLFEIHQGVLTGFNDAFLLSAGDVQQLPPEERQFFFPAASTSTICDGRLLSSEYVFYPHFTNSPLQTLEDVQSLVPTYFASKLLPARNRLISRRDKNESNWWTLTWPRSWQADFSPKLLTAYFGAMGKFAYDAKAKYVCLHGYAWLWKENESAAEIDNEVNESVLFHDSQAPFAYVALLNSRPFSILLSCFCQRVQGGQYNLSKRFVRSIPLPNLVDGYTSGRVVSELAYLGHRMASGDEIDHEQLNAFVSHAYGVKPDAWGLDEED